jgi:MinD-like ATPase involved in chromosome partitioning or flagellar assembly
MERIIAIQNRSIGLEGLSRTEAEKLIEIPIQFSIPHLAENLAVASNRHEPFALRFPNDATAMTFQIIADQLVETADKNKR